MGRALTYYIIIIHKPMKFLSTPNKVKLPYTGLKPFSAVLKDFTKAAFEIDYRFEIDSYQDLFIRRITSNGKKEAAMFLKALYVYATRVSLGYEDIEPLPWTKSDKEGFPSCIHFMKKDLCSPDFNRRRAALTVLRQYETIFCDPEPDLESITKPGPGPGVWDPYRSEWQHFLVDKFRKMSPEIKDELLHMTARNGPNGPALPRAHIDALAVFQDKNIYEGIRSLNSSRAIPQRDPRITRGEKKDAVFAATLRLGEKLRNRWQKPELHSRLQFLAVGGCKTRTIAICDFFSQDALRPLHKWAYRFLSKLSTDGTFSHNRISHILCENTRMKKPSYCFDLTTATDRFPVWLQTEFLSMVIDPDLALSWETVICKRKFAIPGSEHSVEYACGQPMGALSSWPVFALTHHAIIEFCAHLEGISSFREYAVIGDDVAIFNEQVASRYKDILEVLEVPISIAKSVSSKGGAQYSRGEIAKRFFLNGTELSPIPTGAIYSARKDKLLFPNLVRLCQERGVSSFFKQAPVHEVSEKWYSATNHKLVGALLFYPTDPVLPIERDNTWDPWKQFTIEDVTNKFRDVFKRRLTDKADRVYKELLIEFNDDPIWGGLMEDLYDQDLPLHPMSLMWRSIRDKISQSYLKLKGTLDFDPFEIEFILDPLLRDYRRKSHRRTRLKGILVQRVLQELESDPLSTSFVATSEVD